MKLAQLIVPEWTPDKQPRREMVSELRARILGRWGLYTESHQIMGIHAQDEVTREPVLVFSIPMDRADVVHLREMAQDLARRWLLGSVIIVTPVGDWEVVK